MGGGCIWYGLIFLTPLDDSPQGVVFNEMKGVYSSPDSVYYRVVQQVWRGGMEGIYVSWRSFGTVQ